MKALIVSSLFLIILLVFCDSVVLAQSGSTRKHIVKGIDHLPIAVANLDSAADHFRRLGFTIKPGRFHANGIKNIHIKFNNGTELELITADKEKDELSAEYCNIIADGGGPAFLGLYAPDTTALMKLLVKFNVSSV